jgi:hypothetical protein
MGGITIAGFLASMAFFSWLGKKSRKEVKMTKDENLSEEDSGSEDPGKRRRGKNGGKGREWTKEYETDFASEWNGI